MFGVATAVLLVAILVVANVVSSNFFGRIDLTQGNIFSLDAASKRIVGQLDDTFLVKAYFSKNLPAPYNANAKYVQERMEEYHAYGKGRFRFEFVDPGSDAKLEEEAQKHRISPVQVQVLEHDQFAAKAAYMGLVFLFQDRQETIREVENPTGLEYEITTTIQKVTNPTRQLPVVGFLVGHQEPSLQQLTTVQQVFQKQYQLRPVELSGGQRVAADVQVLLVASPRSPFSPWEKYAIDQFIMRGGKV